MAKFIFDLPNEELLPLTFGLLEKINDFCKVVTVEQDDSDTLSPIVREEDETDDQYNARLKEYRKKKREINKKYLMRLAKKACVEHPKESAALSDAFWQREKDGEVLPSAIVTFPKAIFRKDVLDFFVLLKALV